MGQHRSTRNRCNACKIRKVKCDGARPACLQCLKQANICTYGKGESAFRSSVENVIEFYPDMKPTRINEDHQDNDNTSSVLSFPRFGQSRMQLCHPIVRFILRTGPSMLARSARVTYPKAILRLVQGRPYLKHAVLTVTFTHDWTLHGSDCGRAAMIQAYHMSACARSLHDRLCQPLDGADRDALWASAALLMCAHVAGMGTGTYTIDDLDWIHVCRRTANLALGWEVLQEGGLRMCWPNPQTYWPSVALIAPATTAEQMLDYAIEDAMTDALGCEDRIIRHDLVTGLQMLMRLQCDTQTIFEFLAWFTVWPDLLFTNIKSRNASALLVLALWCTKTCKFRWWISRRAFSILQEICIHLDRVSVPNSSCEILLNYCKTVYNETSGRRTSGFA